MFEIVMNSPPNKFKALFRDTAFNVGFLLGIGIFVFLNYLSYIKSYTEANKLRMFSAGGYFVGFPFDAYHSYWGYPNGDDILLLGFTADILIAIISSFVIGLIVRSIWFRVAAGRMS